MDELIKEISVPGVVTLFGEYGSPFGEPAIAVPIDLSLNLKVKNAEYDFFVVDGYKLDRKRHIYFDTALHKLWKGTPLEFITQSQMPMVSGFGTDSALIVALTKVLLGLSVDVDKDIKNSKGKKKSQPLAHISRKAFTIEKAINTMISPLNISTIILGRPLLMDNYIQNSFWKITIGDKRWCAHKVTGLEGVSLVIGYPKQQKTYSAANLRPLYDSPPKPSSARKSKQRTSKSTSHYVYPSSDEPILTKLQRFTSRSGFAKDNIKEMGRNALAAVEAIKSRDLPKIGELMSKQQNSLKILGILPDELKSIFEAAKKNSYGVSLTGRYGDSVVAITKDPKKVVKNITDAGFEAVITKVQGD